MQLNVIQSESLQALMRDHGDNVSSDNKARNYPKGFGGRAWDEARHLIMSGGDENMAQRAAALTDAIVLEASGEARAFVPSPVGAYPCIPDVLSGFPEPMRRIDHIEGEGRPVSVHVCITSACVLRPDQLESRGAALLALCMALVREGRSVDLWAVSTLDSLRAQEPLSRDGSIIRWRIETRPFDLGIAAMSLVDTSISRRLTHAIAFHQHGYTGWWPKGLNPMSPIPWCAKYKEHAGCDLVVPMAGVLEGDPLLTDPVGWVQQQLDAMRVFAA